LQANEKNITSYPFIFILLKQDVGECL